MAPDAAERILARCDELALITEEPGRLTRRSCTPQMAEANALMQRWMAEAGLQVRVDPAGNLIGRRDGREPEAGTLLLGSHLDTVRDAGAYDGPLGLLVALEAVGRAETPCALEVIAFNDEEGLRFRSAYLGSKALTGALTGDLLELRDRDGISVADALPVVGGDPGRLDEAVRRDLLRGYVEVHIEQGPVLDDAALPVGVVTAIAGATRAHIRFRGRAAHAGTTPMAGRNDALAAAAEWVVAVENIGGASDELFATVGELELPSAAPNVVPGEVHASVDVRHGRDEVRHKAFAAVQHAAQRAARRRGVDCTIRTTLMTEAVPCGDRLVRDLGRAVQAAGVPLRELPSGAGHDGVALADLCDVGMLFVRCAGGVSHHPDESVRAEDVEVAVDVLARFLAPHH